MEPLKGPFPDDMSELALQKSKAPIEFVDEKLG
jgi:hypothetical protein